MNLRINEHRFSGVKLYSLKQKETIHKIAVLNTERKEPSQPPFYTARIKQKAKIIAPLPDNNKSSLSQIKLYRIEPSDINTTLYKDALFLGNGGEYACHISAALNTARAYFVSTKQPIPKKIANSDGALRWAFDYLRNHSTHIGYRNLQDNGCVLNHPELQAITAKVLFEALNIPYAEHHAVTTKWSGSSHKELVQNYDRMGLAKLFEDLETLKPCKIGYSIKKEGNSLPNYGHAVTALQFIAGPNHDAFLESLVNGDSKYLTLTNTGHFIVYDQEKCGYRKMELHEIIQNAFDFQAYVPGSFYCC